MPAGVYDAFDDIIARIKAQMPGVFAICDSPGVVNSEEEVLAKLPGCYVKPGVSEPTPEGNNLVLKGEDQDWFVKITVRYPGSGTAAPETVLGQHVLGVIQSLNGWSPLNDKFKIKYQRRSAVEYDEGYAFVILLFTHRKIIT
jgi:hypothetical protein